MTFRDIFKSDFLENVTAVSMTDMCIALALAFALGLLIFLVYKRSYSGVMYSASFGVTLVALCLITTLLMMAVVSNVVLSLGMVGALSIVRFRAAVKEPMDIAFLFWCIAVGIVLAAGLIPLAVFVFLAAVNSVNLTDGLDGLAGGSAAAYFLSMGLLLCVQVRFPAVAGLCFCLTGALAAFLVFNTNRASVFMGDTGSLGLGGFVACTGIFTGNLLYIAVIGAVFVLSSITVILQVIYYKKTGKRVFLMAPVHHHFQEKGYSESKIAYCYALVTTLLGALCLLALL